MAKQRNFKLEYRQRIESGLRRGYSRQQAAGHPGSGELHIRPKVDPKHKASYDALVKRLNDKNFNSKDRKRAVNLLKKSLKDVFERRKNGNEEPRPFDMFLLAIGDNGPGEFAGGSEDTAALGDDLKAGLYADQANQLPDRVIDQLGLDLAFNE